MNDFAQALIDYAEGREPEKYPGTFTKRISDEIAAQVPTSWGIEAWKVYAKHRIVKYQADDLGAFGTEFDVWFPETRLTSSKSWMFHTPRMIASLGREGFLYQVSPITGNPICINCASPMTPIWKDKAKTEYGSCEPCEFCKSNPIFNKVK